MSTVKLIAKNLRGTNILKDAGTDSWKVESTVEEFPFKYPAGAWLHVVPLKGNPFALRGWWVHKDDDENFEVRYD